MATNPTIIRKAPWTVEVRRELIWPKTNTEGRIIWGLGVKKSYVDNSGKRYDQAPWGASIPQNNSNNGWEETLDDIIKNNNRQNQQRESESELNNIIQTNNQQKQNNTQNNAVVVASNNNNGLRNTLPWGGNVSPPTSEFPEVPTESGTVPAPTVATINNPVIKKTKPNDITVATPEQIVQLDENGVYDIIDSLDFKVSQGKALTMEEYKSLNAARRQLQNMSKPQNLAGGLDNLIAQQEQKITDTKKENSEQDAADLETFTNAQESYKATQLEELNTAQDLERKRLSFIFGANGGGKGTGTIAAYNNMERNFTGKKQALEDAVQAKIDLYGSQLRKDSQATIDKFEENVLKLQMKAAEFDVANIQELNDYNKENSKTAIEKLDKLKEFSDAVIANQTPLTEQEQAQADARAVSLVKPDGTVNNELLTILQKTNPKIAMRALSASVDMQKTRVQDELDAKKAANLMENQYKQAQINNLNKPDKITYSSVKNEDGTITLISSDGSTRTVDPSQVVEWGGVNPDFRNPNVNAAVRNNNPWNITDTSFGGQKIDGERFTVFNTPWEGINALVNKVKFNQTDPKSRYYGKTIGEYFKIYAPSEDGNNPTSYAQDIAKKLGVTTDTKISAVQADRLAGAISSHEDKDMFALLKRNGLVNEDYSVNVSTNLWSTKKITPEKKQMYEDAILAIEDLETTEGGQGAIGNSFNKMFTPWFLQGEDSQLARGSKAANFETKFKSLQSMLTLPNLDKLKGAMSDKDILFLKSASNSLNLNMSEKEFYKTLKKVKETYQRNLWIEPTVETPPTNNSGAGDISQSNLDYLDSLGL